VSHYETLGVPPTAGPDELHDAFKNLARRYHPDRTAGQAAAERQAADDRMRNINAAWSVLSDPGRRRSYDHQLGLATETSKAFVRRVTPTTFVPFYAEDEDDDDAWRYEPDIGVPGTAPSRRLLMIPLGLVALAMAVLLAWMILDVQALLGVAVAVGVVGGVSFFAVPILVMSKAADAERR